MEDGARGVSEGGEEGCEEAGETMGRRRCWVGCFGVEKPLQDGNATVWVSCEIMRLGNDARAPYCSIEATRTESEPLSNIL